MKWSIAETVSRRKKLMKGVYHGESGAIAAWFALMVPVFIGFGALALDVSYAMMMRHRLQVTSSAAALAGAGGLTISQDEAKVRADEYAAANFQNFGDVAPVDSNIKVGFWTFGSGGLPGSFVETATDPNAVQVITELTTDNNNPLNVFLAGIANVNFFDITTVATAVNYPETEFDTCLLALNPDPNVTGVEATGTVEIQAPGCGVCVASTNDDDAMLVAGTSTEINVEGGGIYVAGEYRENGNPTVVPSPDYEGTENLFSEPEPATMCPDPLADLDLYDDVLDDLNMICSASPYPTTAEAIISTLNGNIVLPVNPPPVYVSYLDPNPITVPAVLDSALARSVGDEVSGFRFVPGIYCAGPTTGGIDITAHLPAVPPLADGADSTRWAPEAIEFHSTGIDSEGVVIPNDTARVTDNGYYFHDTNFDINGWSANERFITTGADGSTFVLANSRVSFESDINANFVGTINPDTGEPGFVFYQDPDEVADSGNDNQAEHNINGGSDFFMSGTLYFGMADVSISGGITADDSLAGGCLALIAGTWDFNGGGGQDVNLNLSAVGCDQAANSGPALYSVRLVD